MRLPDVCINRPTPRAPVTNRSTPSAFSTEERGALDGAPPASAGLSRSPRPRRGAPTALALGRGSYAFRGSCAARTVGFFARSREQRSSRAAFSAAPGASETASGTRVVTGTEMPAPPGSSPPVLPSRRPTRSIRGRLMPVERSRVRRRLQSRTIHEHRRESDGPRAAGRRLPSRPHCRAAPPHSRRCRPCFLGSGESVAASAAPHPPPGAPSGITPKPICPSTPVARPWRGRLEEPTLPATRGGLYQRAHAPLTRGVPVTRRFRDAPPEGRFHALLREEEPGFP